MIYLCCGGVNMEKTKDNIGKLLKVEKEILEDFCENISENKIEFDEFKFYYDVLRNYIENGPGDYLPYLLSFKNCIVLLDISVSQMELFNKYKVEIDKLIMYNKEEIRNAKKLSENTFLLYENYMYSFQKLKLARLSRLEDIDLLTWAKNLMNINGTFIENKFYNLSDEKKYLEELIASLEKESKTPKK